MTPCAIGQGVAAFLREEKTVAIRQAELPEEGSEEEALEVLRQAPLRMPSYDLKRVAVKDLLVDYAAPAGDGYARPLSENRLRILRRDWDPMACSPLVISKRADGSLFVVDGNHRRMVAFDKGILTLPAQIFSGLTREREADLYVKLGTTLGQTPWTRFQSKLIAGDLESKDIVRIANYHGLEVNAISYMDGRIQAIARLEGIYERGGPEGLDWTLGVLANAFDGNRESLGEMQLEGVFSFWQRYAPLVDGDEVSQLLAAGGLNAWHDRAASIWGRVDVGKRSNTYGMAVADLLNETWKRKGKKLKELLPAWPPNIAQLGGPRRPATRSGYSAASTLAPQHLGED
jgi:hypothetical protein